MPWYRTYTACRSTAHTLHAAVPHSTLHAAVRTTLHVTVPHYSACHGTAHMLHTAVPHIRCMPRYHTYAGTYARSSTLTNTATQGHIRTEPQSATFKQSHRGPHSHSHSHSHICLHNSRPLPWPLSPPLSPPPHLHEQQPPVLRGQHNAAISQPAVVNDHHLAQALQAL